MVAIRKEVREKVTRLIKERHDCLRRAEELEKLIRLESLGSNKNF